MLFFGFKDAVVENLLVAVVENLLALSHCD